MKFTIEIYQSLLKPLFLNNDELQQFEHALQSLNSLGSIHLYLHGTIESELSITSSIIPDELQSQWRWHKKYSEHITEYCYKFTAKVEIDSNVYNIIEINNIDEFNYKSLLHSVLQSSVEKRFYEFLMVLDLCIVGGYKFGLGFVCQYEGGYEKLKRMDIYTREILSHSIEKNWPKFEKLDIRKTWDWFTSNLNPSGIDEISSSRLSRAFYAASYLYEESESINKIFWTMVGLEALYVSGKEGISEQLRLKGQLYLGEINEFKKRLSRIYEFRSAFIHGSKDFPSYFHVHDGTDSYQNFSSESYEVSLTAISMLLATLQKMAQENRSNLHFEYIIK